MADATNLPPHDLGYLRHRQVIGTLGISLPWVLLIAGTAGGVAQQPTLSHYFHTSVGNWFVGILWALGSFLALYRGYGRVDQKLSLAAGVLAIGVAQFPNDAQGHSTWTGWVHVACAALFFAALFWMCLCEFTQGDETRGRKAARNGVYRGCAWVIFTAVLAIPVVKHLAQMGSVETHAVFWLETIAVTDFGAAFLVKGEWILADAGAGGGSH